MHQNTLQTNQGTFKWRNSSLGEYNTSRIFAVGFRSYNYDSNAVYMIYRLFS